MKHNKLLFIFGLFFFFASGVQAQSSRENEKAPTSQFKSPKKTLKEIEKSKKAWAKEQKRVAKAREKSRKEIQKRKRKEARLKKKPQYSNPTYLGHKRKPKKRKPGKMKMCKECGMKH